MQVFLKQSAKRITMTKNSANYQVHIHFPVELEWTVVSRTMYFELQGSRIN